MDTSHGLSAPGYPGRCIRDVGGVADFALRCGMMPMTR